MEFAFVEGKGLVVVCSVNDPFLDLVYSACGKRVSERHGSVTRQPLDHTDQLAGIRDGFDL